MNIGDVLDEYRGVIDQIDELNASLKALREQKERLESQIIEAAEKSGVTEFANDNLKATIREDFVASYDPAQWTDMVRWAVETHNEHIIQRRLSTRPVTELIDSGHALHPGIVLQPQTKINVRRR